MKSNNVKRFCALLLAILAVAAGSGVLAFGQSTYGSLTGQVTDPMGAAIPGATVTFTNVGTNLALTATSDSTGIYGVKLVPSGNYILKVSFPGFADYIQKGIVMEANLYATQNVQLKVGTAKDQTVTVTANAELINTTTAELGMTVNEQSIVDLPLNGRDPSALALLAPGMIDSTKIGISWEPSGGEFPNESSASADGGRNGSVYYMLDGVSNMDNYLYTNSPTPNPDAIQNFRLISDNFSAVYGFSTGGVVSMATRSGTNQWHGGLFEYMRNGDFDAPNWSNHVQDTYRRNQFGGFVGGPVIKNKLFFFFNYQGTIIAGAPGSSNNSTTTPTEQMLSGDFSGLVTYDQASNPGTCGAVGTTVPAGVAQECGVLNGPFQTVNGVYNQLIGGAAALNPAAVQVTNDGLPGHIAPAYGTAAPTSSAQNLVGQMLYTTANLASQTYNEYTGRVDYDLSKSQRLTVRSYIDKYVQPAGDTPGNVLSVNAGANLWYFNEMVQHTWTLSPNTVNTATVLWTQQSTHGGAQVLDHNGDPMCWSRYIAIIEPACYMEGANFGGASGLWTVPGGDIRGTEGVSDTFIRTIKNHNISVGIDLQHIRAVENAVDYPADAIIGFGGGYTGNGLADWLLGYMSSFEQGAGELPDIQGWEVDPYVNDEWRVKPGLTLTLGIRWDPDLAPVSVGGRGSAFVAGQQSTVFPNAPTGLVFPGDRGVNDALRPSDKAFFEPRIGIAFQPRNMPHTSFHAAFGMFSAPVPYSDYNHAVDIAPFSPTFAPAAPSNVPICSTGRATATCTPNSGQSIAGYMNFNDPWSTSSFGTNGVSPFPPFASIGYKPPTNSAIQGPVYEQDSFSRNFHAGMTQAWNLAVEHQFNATMAIQIAYVGNESYHQSYVQDDNFAGYSYCTSYTSPSCPPPATAPPPVAPYSNFTGILEYDSGATSNYNALQVTFQRHMAHGLQAQSSFTWAKTMDVTSFANIAGNQSGINNPRNLGWSHGVSSSSIPFTWVSNFIYHSPDLKSHNLFVREALGGWELSPIATWESGEAFSIAGGSSQAAYGEPGYGGGCLQFCSGDRADRVPGVPLKVRQGGRSHWTKQYFNPAAFTTRHDGTFGNSARNIIFGPPGFNVDAALMKNWSIMGRYHLQFRFDLFNAFNHPIMGDPDTTPTDSTFGAIGGTNGNDGLGSASNTPRVGQAALRLTF